MGCTRPVVWVVLVAAGCNRLFDIAEIPYAGPVDAARLTDGGGSGIDADLGPLDLTVELTGMSVGSIVDDQMKLNCVGASGTTCQQSYPSGHVKLTPSTTPPAEFAAWGSACVDQNGNDPPSCVLTTGGAVTVTADFESGNVLNVIPSSNNQADGVAGAFISVDGSPCQAGSACTYAFPAGTITVTLDGNSTPCALLESYSGACSLTPDCSIVFGSGASITTVEYTYVLGNGSNCSE
jgi:hypothetical protein